METPTGASGILSGDEYHENFDPNTYLKDYYSTPEGDPEEEGLLPFWLNTLHEIFTKEGLSGDRLINIGSGPCIHDLISACTKFSEIVCCEFLEDNRNAIKRWLNDDKDAFNWKPIIQYVCELEGHSEVEAREKTLRNTIKEVVQCDLFKDDPIEPHKFPQFDCLVTSLTLESACLTNDHWKQAVKNISNYLKPGGAFVQICESGKFYSVGEKKFAAHVSDEFVKSAVLEAGFKDLKCHYKDRVVNLNECKRVDYDFSIVLTASKI
ncbi:indolethylamine N-methyltransferase-like [Ptychodera flava]|uniref:indolethylamine N-methyltransferase-like n=1 Tax=Ptychodera flava TaxID=63121 RepID=UPI00396A7E40